MPLKQPRREPPDPTAGEKPSRRKRSGFHRPPRPAPANALARLLLNPGEDLFEATEWVALGAALRLSSRELCIAVLTVQGKSQAAMARKLHLSRETVRTFVQRLHRKLHVKDRVGVVLRIVRAHRQLSKAP